MRGPTKTGPKGKVFSSNNAFIQNKRVTKKEAIMEKV